MTADVRDTAQALVQAVLRHAELVAGSDAEGRQEAGRALVTALDAYGVAVFGLRLSSRYRSILVSDNIS